MESRIQGCLGFPCMRGGFSFNFCIKHSFWSMKLKVHAQAELSRPSPVADQGERLGGPGPSPYLRVWMTAPPAPPPSLMRRSRSATVVVYITSLLTIQVSLLSELTFVRENATYDLVFLYLLFYFSYADLSGTFS